MWDSPNSKKRELEGGGIALHLETKQGKRDSACIKRFLASFSMAICILKGSQVSAQVITMEDN
jgi:hypothetical protein